MKETMYAGVDAFGAAVIFCVRGELHTVSPYSGALDPWCTPAGYIGFTYWQNFPYNPNDYSDVQLVWEREV